MVKESKYNYAVGTKEYNSEKAKRHYKKKQQAEQVRKWKVVIEKVVSKSYEDGKTLDDIALEMYNESKLFLRARKD